MEIGNYVFQNLEQNLERLVGLQNDHVKGAYRFIPYHPEAFLKLMQVAKDLWLERWFESHSNRETHGAPMFLDVGCGIGTKVFLASTYFSAYGLEISGVYAKIASVITTGGYNSTRIIVADALKYDDYEKYDIIYFYHPLCDQKMQKQLEDRIAKQCKKGCIVLPVYDLESQVWFNKDGKKPGFKRYNRSNEQLFVKL